MLKLQIDNFWEQLRYNQEAPMLFNSGLFLLLFCVFSLIYSILQKKHTLRVAWVVVFSWYFYYKSSGQYFLFLVAATFIDFVLAWFIEDARRVFFKKMWLIVSLVLNLGVLAYFKYGNFMLENWAALTDSTVPLLGIFLPVGISFYTFQSLSYTIDVYRGEIKPVKSILDYAFFVSFFPQLVAGPIVRAKEFIPQLFQPVFVSRDAFGKAIFLIGCGLFKKTIISDYLSLNLVDRVFENPMLYSGLENLLGVYGYAIQIYCDFSGYSDMAIGIALLLGFKYPLNFNAPYQSSNITEFWQRWHISLSTWLRDYLYISLGGNRKGTFRTYINLMITMLLGGLWHGAAWKFILWGGLHGGALAVHKSWKNPIPRWVGILITFHFVAFAWIPFRAENLTISCQVLAQIFTHFTAENLPLVITGYAKVLCVLMLGYVLHFIPKRWDKRSETFIIKTPLLSKALWLLLIIWWMIQVQSSEIQPFIYFQF